MLEIKFWNFLDHWYRPLHVTSGPRRPIDACMCMCTCTSRGRGGWQLTPRHAKFAIHATTRLIAHMQYNTPVGILALNISFMSPDGNVHARPSQWEGGASKIPRAKSGQNTACDQCPLPVYTIMLNLGLFYISPRMKNGVHACTTSSGGGGTRPLPTPSTVTPCYDTPVSHASPSIKSWLNKQAIFADHAIFPFRQELDMYTLWFSSYKEIHINFNNYRRRARRASVEEWK